MDNVARLRRAYQAWHDSRGTSEQVWFELLADDVFIRSIADGTAGMEFSAPRRSRAEAAHYFAGLAKNWEMIHFTPDEFIDAGDRVVMVGRCAWRHRGTGRSVESPLAHIWRFRDGKVVEVIEFYDTAKAIAATQSG